MRDNWDGACEEIEYARVVIRNLACGALTKEAAAWWLAANFRSSVADDWTLRNLAAEHGPPPKGGTWDAWFEKS